MWNNFSELEAGDFVFGDAILEELNAAIVSSHNTLKHDETVSSGDGGVRERAKRILWRLRGLFMRIRRCNVDVAEAVKEYDCIVGDCATLWRPEGDRNILNHL